MGFAVIPRLEWNKRGRRLGRRLRERLGIVGLIGMGLLLLAAVLSAYAPPLARKAQDLQTAAEHTRGLLEETRQQLAKQPGSSQQAAQLREWFPTIDRSSADLRVMFDTAQRHRIELAKGEYALAQVADASRLQRFEVVLPIKERYGTIKAFVAEVLKAVPHASLAELRIERNAANVEVLDARVHFTLFYRAS
jgi:hypothetical protein